MYSLSNEQKQVLFDYSLGLAAEREAEQAKALIASNKEAAEVHSKLKAVLSPLDTVQPEPCPDELAERTVWRLIQLANARQAVKRPERIVVKSRLWHRAAKVGAIAAVILLGVGVLLPSFSFARHQYQKHVCQSQLANIYQSIANYSSDYDDRLPTVTTDVSQP
jgi:anti-sigma-K factor RskA